MMKSNHGIIHSHSITAFLILCIMLSGVLSSETLEERIDGILSRMTLEEKILQVHQEGGMNTGGFSKTGKILHLK